MRKIILVTLLSGLTFLAHAQPSNYAWRAEFDGNFTNIRVFNDGAAGAAFRSLTVQATSSDDQYIIEWNSFADKWQNGASPLNSEFTLFHGDNNSPDGVVTGGVTSGKYYSFQIDGLSYSNRNAVIMETDNAPVGFHATASTAVSTPSANSVNPGQEVLINVELAAGKSAQERVFVRYSTDNFATSAVVEATGTGSTWTTASATIPASVNTLGATVSYCAYTTTVAATNTSNHDLISLRLANNGGSNYSYTVNSAYLSLQAGNWTDVDTWGGTAIPAANQAIQIDHNVTLDQDASVASLSIGSGATFTASDANARTLTILRSASGSATTLSNSGTWANGSGGSTVVFSGAPSSGDAIHQTSGSLALQNVTINKTGGANNVGVDFQTGSSVDGTLQIGSGGYVSTAPPSGFYTANAILAFNQGSAATYDVNAGDFTWSTSEIPQNITVSSGTVNLNGDRTATGDLIVSGSATLSLAPTVDLQIDGNFDLDGTISLNADGTGYSQLKVSGTLTDNGTFNHEQNLSAGWRMIAASMNASQASYFGNVGSSGSGHTSNTQNLFSWDGTNYVNLADNNASISPGTGYFGYVGTFGFRAAGVENFTGTPNTSVTPSLSDGTASGSITIEGTHTNERQGWNLVANPFTCALDFATLSRSDVDNAFYIYDGTSYVAYSGAGLPSSAIAPMQSFWVKANGGSPSLGTMTMAANGTVAESPALLKTTTKNFDRLVLRSQELADSLNSDYTVVAFIQGTQDAYDNEWDAYKMANGGDQPNIYSLHQGTGMATNAIDYGPGYDGIKSLDIAFRAPKHGEPYQISYDQNYMLRDYAVYLEDRKNQSFHNLAHSPYRFAHDSGMVQRFVLHLQSNSVDIEEFDKAQSSLQAWAHEGQLHFLANYGAPVSVELRNINGQSVYRSALDLHAGRLQSQSLPEMAPGLYLLSVSEKGAARHFKVYLP